MPTMGRASASSDRPIALMKALRRKSENSASPYDVSPFFIPVAMMSVANLVADFQQVHAQAADENQAHPDHTQADPRRNIADAEEAVPEAVDHVEERVEVAHRLPQRRQRVHRIEDP